MKKNDKRTELVKATYVMKDVMRPIMISTILLQLITKSKIFAIMNMISGTIALGWVFGSVAAMVKLNK